MTDVDRELESWLKSTEATKALRMMSLMAFKYAFSHGRDCGPAVGFRAGAAALEVAIDNVDAVVNS